MDSIVEDLEATNSVLENHGFTLQKVAIKNNVTDFPFDNIEEEYYKIINESLPSLRKRLNPNTPPRIPHYALILEDDAHDW